MCFGVGRGKGVEERRVESAYDIVSRCWRGFAYPEVIGRVGDVAEHAANDRGHKRPRPGADREGPVAVEAVAAKRDVERAELVGAGAAAGGHHELELDARAMRAVRDPSDDLGVGLSRMTAASVDPKP